MCGIVAWHRLREPIDEGALGQATLRLAHRGPDGSGVWVSPERAVGLGHRRLAIIDTSTAGLQPMRDEASDCTITFNGEIFNYRALRDDLIASGQGFATATDTEVILKAYAAWGTACLDKLVGQFAFVLHDRRRNLLFLARDRAGEKPMFYRHDQNGLAVASELKALLELDGGERVIDRRALAEYLAWGYVGADRCLLQGYAKLQPGTMAIYDLESSSLKTERYWTPPQRAAHDDGSIGIGDYSSELERLLGEAVKGQLVADVPLGIFLSGGIDSSLVAALAARASSKIKTFTISFPDAPQLDEARYARRVAEYLGTDHTEIPVSTIEPGLVDTLVRQIDEPIADVSMVPTAILSQAVRRHVTVALGGDGADELFGGYPQYSHLARIDALRTRSAPAMRRRMADAIAGFATAIPGGNAMHSVFDDPGSIGSFNVYLNEQTQRSLLPSQVVRREWATERARDCLVVDGLPAGERASRADFASYLPDEVLVKVDRASMLYGLETRAPFLDHRVIEFALGTVPWRCKIQGSDKKVLLQDLIKRLLPGVLDSRQKQGFTPPLSGWLANALLPDVNAMTTHLASIGFDAKVIKDLGRSQHRNANRYFLLIVLSKWMRHYRVSL